MRPSVRLSALMEQQCLWIYTHDSVFLGEDGPTHQPVEHLWALRLIPNLAVLRPADGLEVAAAWSIALSRKKGPTAFALTRQKLPKIERDKSFDPKTMLRGAYIVREASGGKPDVIIIATGSELHLATTAQAALEKNGHKVRVVSALCLETFFQQDEAYRATVLPDAARKASIEAGRTEPWLGVIGAEGLPIGIDRFGASAPDKVIAEKLGFTAPAITQRIETWLRA
jgi:transketolase